MAKTGGGPSAFTESSENKTARPAGWLIEPVWPIVSNSWTKSLFTPEYVRMNVLVVGGAGYIGSHCVRQLSAAGHRPVVVDNLVYGHRGALGPEIAFYDVNLGDEAAVGRILRREGIELVMHFAAFCYVGESVTNPMKYYGNNVAATLLLLRTMLGAGVKRFVFSSTCATFGVPDKLPIVETQVQAPINPYGQTKLDIEIALKALAPGHGLSFAAFRYFNAAGAAEDGAIGEDHDPESHLIPVAIDAALGKRPHLDLFGTDYPTPDGTCLRDCPCGRSLPRPYPRFQPS
jgi:UDP-glucose 4-epimerase